MNDKSEQEPSVPDMPGSTEWWVQFLHPDKILGLGQPLEVLEVSAQEALWDCSIERAAEIRAACARRVEAQASTMLADKAFAALVARIPLARGARIVAYGDSVTDDLHSWARLLQAVLRLARPEDGIQVVELGRSSDTTTHLIERFGVVAVAQPDWVVVLVGINDAKEYRAVDDAVLVSPDETSRNARLLSRLIEDTGARQVWMLPAQVDESSIEQCEFWEQIGIRWSAKGVEATRSAIATSTTTTLDLKPHFESADPDERLLLGDGVHPTLSGQATITSALCEWFDSALVADTSGSAA